MSDDNRTRKGILLSGFIAFIFVFLYELLVHGFLMAGLYEATASVWRPSSESNMAVMLLSQFLFAMAIAFFYPIVGPDKDCKKAWPFGLGLGLVLAMPQISTYSYLPIPISISLLWSLSSFIEAFISAIIVAKVFNRFVGK